MSKAQEIIEEELIEEQKAKEEYDAVFFADENGAPNVAPKEEDEEVDDSPQETVEEKETEPDEIPEGETKEEADKKVEPEVIPLEEEEQPEKDSEPKQTIRWNGKDVEVTMEELKAMAQQGFDYTYKSQHLAQDKLDHQSELALLTKVREGDKEALAQLSKQSGIDPLDLMDINVDNIEQGYSKPAEPFMSPQVEQLMQEVQKDSELYEKMRHIEHDLPSAVINIMAKDAGTFYSIVDEVRSGDAAIVLPQVTAKMATLPELDRALIMNNPEQYKNFYISVKQSMMQEQPAPTTTTQQAPVEKRVKPNPAEVGVKRSGGTPRDREEATDSMSSDKEYEAILQRLRNQ